MQIWIPLDFGGNAKNILQEHELHATRNKIRSSLHTVQPVFVCQIHQCFEVNTNMRPTRTRLIITYI